MSVLSVPLTAELEKAIQSLIDLGVASNKADAARKAIMRLEEEAAIGVVLQSEQEVAEGKVISGNVEDFLDL